jgi:hypothetical protein
MADPRPRGSLLADLRPLRESPAFRRLWIGTTVARRTARAEPDPDGEGAPVNTAIAT